MDRSKGTLGFLNSETPQFRLEFWAHGLGTACRKACNLQPKKCGITCGPTPAEGTRTLSFACGGSMVMQRSWRLRMGVLGLRGLKGFRV